MPINIWLNAIRPKTILASIAPVLIGIAMAFGDGGFHAPSACAALAAAVLIQIGTNLANDYFDWKNGVDTPERQKSRPSSILTGALTPQQVKWGFMTALFLAGILGGYLMFRAGWPIVIIGIFSITSAILYSAGPWSLAKTGLADLFVFVFFGPIAVGGTYYVQTFDINGAVILAGCAPGALSVAILTVNNLRDIKTDTRAGRKTLPIRFGRSFGRGEYLVSFLTAFLVPPVVTALTGEHHWLSLAALSLLLLIPVIEIIYTAEDGPTLNKALASTAKVLLIYSLVFSVAWNI